MTEVQSLPALVDARPCYRVALFGLGDRFEQLLDVVARHARHNNYRYEIAEQGGPVEFDIALVDMTAPGGPAVARTLKDSPQSLPVIGVGRRSNRRSGNDDLLLASFSLDVLGVLNKAARSLSKRGDETQAQGHQAPPDGRPRLPQVNGRSPRALVIEPSPSIRSQLAVALRQIGVDAEGVGTIAQAEDVLSMRTYELVILEPRQPDGDGLTMLRRLRHGSGFLKLVIPVIVLSSRSGIFDLVKAAWAGCNGYLDKPVALSSLHSTVSRVLLRSLRARLGTQRLDAQRKADALVPSPVMEHPGLAGDAEAGFQDSGSPALQLRIDTNRSGSGFPPPTMHRRAQDYLENAARPAPAASAAAARRARGSAIGAPDAPGATVRSNRERADLSL